MDLHVASTDTISRRPMVHKRIPKGGFAHLFVVLCCVVFCLILNLKPIPSVNNDLDWTSVHIFVEKLPHSLKAPNGVLAWSPGHLHGHFEFVPWRGEEG